MGHNPNKAASTTKTSTPLSLYVRQMWELTRDNESCVPATGRRKRRRADCVRCNDGVRETYRMFRYLTKYWKWKQIVKTQHLNRTEDKGITKKVSVRVPKGKKSFGRAKKRGSRHRSTGLEINMLSATQIMNASCIDVHLFSLLDLNVMLKIPMAVRFSHKPSSGVIILLIVRRQIWEI